MKMAAITDIGSCRQENQDNYCAQQLAGGTAWGIVCDGMGGVSGAEDVLELMLAGATAVGVGAANLVEPYACKHIIETLPDAMARFGIDDLRDIIGGAHHG